MDDIKVFDWDDEIENDGEEFTTVEEGDYDFTVEKFERGNYTPGPNAKTPPCNAADMTLKITTKDGDCFVRDRLLLAGNNEWRISAFFRSIGMKKHGEKLKMDFKGAIGKTGRAHITKTEGQTKGVYFNNVGKYIDPPASAAKKDKDDEWD